MPRVPSSGAAAAGRHALPHLAERLELSLGEMREEMLAHDCAMGTTRRVQALTAAIGETGISTACVVFAAATPEQLVTLQTIHQAREAAARELGLLG